MWIKGLITIIWCIYFIIQSRRLFRLAHIQDLRRWEGIWLRSSLNRLWWWLGQESFWRQAQHDTLVCAQLTIMLAIGSITAGF